MHTECDTESHESANHMSYTAVALKPLCGSCGHIVWPLLPLVSQSCACCYCSGHRVRHVTAVPSLRDRVFFSRSHLRCGFEESTGSPQDRTQESGASQPASSGGSSGHRFRVVRAILALDTSGELGTDVTIRLGGGYVVLPFPTVSLSFLWFPPSLLLSLAPSLSSLVCVSSCLLLSRRFLCGNAPVVIH